MGFLDKHGESGECGKHFLQQMDAYIYLWELLFL